VRHRTGGFFKAVFTGVLLLAAASVSEAWAGNFKVLYSFCNVSSCDDGNGPAAPLQKEPRFAPGLFVFGARPFVVVCLAG